MLWKAFLAACVAHSHFFTIVSCRLPTEPDLVQAYTDIEYQQSGTQFLRWSVEVYGSGDGEWRHKCGGSLVTPSVVISAARCFWENGRQLPASQFVVARTFGGIGTGTVWNAVQKSNVSSIAVPWSYRGRAGLFADDIAVLTLAEPLAGVAPVCVSFDPALEARQLAEGTYGRNMGTLQLAGHGLPSPLFTALEVPYASRKRCANGSEPFFREQLTADKICAGFKPAASGRAESLVCREDHGSGLVFYRGEGFSAVPYLRGVASTPFADPQPPFGTIAGCYTVRYAAYTLVSSQRAFLEQQVPGLEAACARYWPARAAAGYNNHCNCHCNCNCF